MITNANVSKTASSGEYVDIRKYIGVASINVLAINPNNAKLRSYGWSIPEDADEPTYLSIDASGRKSARVRFLVQIQDLKEKPVIALDFWLGSELALTKDGNKCKVIDSFGRTAYGTKAELKAHQIPQYSTGLANISSDYKPCHVGEDALVAFTMKYLNVTPLQVFDTKTQNWKENKNPGRLTIDHWDWLINGNVNELKEYFGMQPENCVKVVLGIRTTEDNKTYQTFLNSTYIGNGARPDRNTGEYTTARKAVDKAIDYANEHGNDYPYIFSAAPVKEWSESATEVSDNSGKMFDKEGNYIDEDEDMPAF